MTMPSAGWYPDPLDDGRQRRWDGQHWTSQVRRVADLPPPMATAAVPSGEASEAPPGPDSPANEGSRGWWLAGGGLALLVLAGLVIALGADRDGDESAGASLAAGGYVTCGLQVDGTPVCWGSDDFGQSSPPDGMVLAAIAPGSTSSCGLQVDGSPICWGFGEAPAGLTLSTINHSGSHVCGLQVDGSPICWGLDDFGQSSPPPGVTLTAIAPGAYHTCGLQPDGVPMCWGHDFHGQASPPAGVTLTAIASGDSHTCGLQADGSPICWGRDQHGQSSPPAGVRLSTGRG